MTLEQFKEQVIALSPGERKQLLGHLSAVMAAPNPQRESHGKSGRDKPPESSAG